MSIRGKLIRQMSGMSGISESPINKAVGRPVGSDVVDRALQEKMVTLYRGMAEPFDPARVGKQGTRFTDDLDYARSNTNQTTHPYLYAVQVPASRVDVGTSAFADLMGDAAGPRGAVLSLDELSDIQRVDPWWDPQGTGALRPSERPFEDIAENVDRVTKNFGKLSKQAESLRQSAVAGPYDIDPLTRLVDDLPTLGDDLRKAVGQGDERAARQLLRRYEDDRQVLHRVQGKPRVRNVSKPSDDPGTKVIQDYAAHPDNTLREAYAGKHAPDSAPGQAVARIREGMEPVDHRLTRFVKNLGGGRFKNAEGMEHGHGVDRVDWSKVKPGQKVNLPLESWTDNPHLKTLEDWRNQSKYRLELDDAEAASMQNLVPGDSIQREWLAAGRAEVQSIEKQGHQTRIVLKAMKGLRNEKSAYIEKGAGSYGDAARVKPDSSVPLPPPTQTLAANRSPRVSTTNYDHRSPFWADSYLSRRL